MWLGGAPRGIKKLVMLLGDVGCREKEKEKKIFLGIEKNKKEDVSW